MSVIFETGSSNLSTVIIVHLISSEFMHSTNLALAINSHHCASGLHCAIFMHFTILPLTLNSHYCEFEFYSTVFIHCTDRAIIYSSYQCSSKLHSALFLHCTSLAPFLNSDYWVSNLHSALLCIPQILLSLLSVISVHLSPMLLCFCMHYAYLALTVNSYNCVCELYFALFMHSTDLALGLESHQCAS